MDGFYEISPTQPVQGTRFLGVLYAEDFDAPTDIETPVLEQAPVEPLFTLAQLEAAQADARRDAVRTARAEWDIGAANIRTQSLVAIAASIAAAQEGARLAADETAGEMVRAVLAILAALLPHLCRLHGDTEVRALLRHLLPQLAQQPRITVRVHPATLKSVREDLRSLDEAVRASVVLTTLDTLDIGDARVGWTNGALRRDSNSIVGALRSALTELGLLEPEPQLLTPVQQNERSKSFAE